MVNKNIIDYSLFLVDGELEILKTFNNDIPDNYYEKVKLIEKYIIKGLKEANNENIHCLIQVEK